MSGNAEKCATMKSTPVTRVKLGIRFTALLGSSRLSPNFIMQRWLFVRQSTQKVAKWRFCRKQGSKRRISLKIDIDAQFGYINYPYSIDPHSDTYRAEQGLSRHVASRRDNLFGKNNIKNWNHNHQGWTQGVGGSRIITISKYGKSQSCSRKRHTHKSQIEHIACIGFSRMQIFSQIEQIWKFIPYINRRGQPTAWGGTTTFLEKIT